MSATMQLQVHLRSSAPSGDLDDDLAESPSLTDVGKSGRDLLQGIGAVDVDPYLPADAELHQRLEVGRALLDDEHAYRPTGEPADQPARGRDAEQRADRPAHAPVGTARRQ